jgi:hypothetical protein
MINIKYLDLCILSYITSYASRANRAEDNGVTLFYGFTGKF